MTSKEALKKIYNTGANMVIGTPLDNFFEEEVKAIAKDLEVLAILKNILKIKKSDLYGFEIQVYGSDEQENKVKEWLEDEKL